MRDSLYAGTLVDGLDKLRPLAAADDHEAWFGIGAIQLTQSIEALAQAFYSHGFVVPGSDTAFAPGIEVPVNPSPEPLDYDGVRAILSDFLAGLDEARTSFVAAGQAGDYVIDINPLLVRVDADGDGKVTDTESLAGLLAIWNRTELEKILAPEDEAAPRFEYIGFDRADAYWLAGYTQAVGAQVEFLLAHDFSGLVDALFHRLFPRAGFPLQDQVASGTMILDPGSDTAIADAIAAIHTLDWPVIAPERLRAVRERLLEVLELSGQNWDAILDETDDNHELLPSPKQTAMIPGTSIDDAKIAAWRATLVKARDVLEGRLLLPHWRFRQGFDLKAYFETATETDLVMILTGLAALPYLAEGPVASAEDFRAMQEAFGDEWLGYALWFN